MAASNGATSASALRASVPENTVVGLMRDLRGVAQATNSRKTYGRLQLMALYCYAHALEGWSLEASAAPKCIR